MVYLEGMIGEQLWLFWPKQIPGSACPIMIPQLTTSNAPIPTSPLTMQPILLHISPSDTVNSCSPRLEYKFQEGKTLFCFVQYPENVWYICLLYTSDAADDWLVV